MFRKRDSYTSKTQQRMSMKDIEDRIKKAQEEDKKAKEEEEEAKIKKERAEKELERTIKERKAHMQNSKTDYSVFEPYNVRNSAIQNKKTLTYNTNRMNKLQREVYGPITGSIKNAVDHGQRVMKSIANTLRLREKNGDYENPPRRKKGGSNKNNKTRKQKKTSKK